MAETAPIVPVDGGFAAHAAAERLDAQQRLGAELAEGLRTRGQEFDVTAGPLDDAAEMRVYGSRGRTYYNPDGSGAVIADAEHPTPSRFDQIRGDEGLDPDPRVRARLAKGYERDIDNLRADEGLNLYQAEEIAEGRLADRRNIFRLTGRFMNGDEKGGRYADGADGAKGKRTPDNAAMEGDEAHARALDVYRRKDAARVREARLENPYTHNDEQARIDAEAANRRGNRDEMIADAERRRRNKEYGRELGKDLGKKRKEEDPKEIARREAEQKEIAGLQERLVGARDDYAHRVAGNSRRAIHWRREFRNSGVTEARREYEAIRNHLGGVIGALYARGGANAEQIDIMAWNGARAEGAALARDIREEKLIATGRGRYTRAKNDDGTVRAEPVQHGGLHRFVHAPANALYNFYARNSVPATGGRRAMQIAKKTVVIGAVGTGAGLAAGLLAGAALPVGAGVAGALAANRITKAYMSSRVRRGARNRLVDLRTSQLQGNMNAWIDDINANGVVNPNAHVGARQWDATVLTDFSERQRRREVRGNRVRLGVMAGGLALGGYGLEHLVMHGQDTQDFFGGNGGAHEHAQSGSGNSNADIGGNRFPWNHGGMGSKGHNGSTPGAGGEINPGEVNPSQLPEVNLHGAEYPWNWAAGKFGADQATPEMLKLVHGLKEHGVDMKVVPLPGNKFAIEGPNADFSTEDVVRYLNAEYEYEQLANAS